MAFRTKLDYSDNRQIKQRERTSTTLSGSTVFGVPFSALTSGPSTTDSGVTETYTVALSTFSGNSATTVFTWYDSRMSLAEPEISALTPSNSGITQDVTVFTASSTTVIDGNTVNLAYTGVSFDLTVLNMNVSGPSYTGTVEHQAIDILSANTLDYTGRTIWIDNTEITRTKKLIVTESPQVGYYLKCVDSEGKAEWSPVSGSSGSPTFTGNTSATCITDLFISNLYGCSPVTVHSSLQHTGSTSSGLLSIAFGDNTVASDIYSFAMGQETSGTSRYSAAFGRFSLASGLGSFAKGEGATASGAWSNAEGRSTIASGVGSHAEGSSTTASGNYSHAEGTITTASGLNSHAEGAVTIASGDKSHAEGQETTASGIYSHAEGLQTTASGNSSHSEGNNTTASGSSSHAEGQLTIAGGDQSHAQNKSTKALGIGSHSEGTSTIASGDFSHAQGSSTTASGLNSHSSGAGTIASGENTYAGGSGAVSSGNTTFTHFSGNSTVHGAFSDNSGILGGVNNRIDALSNNSVILGGKNNRISDSIENTIILGGDGITATTGDMVYVNDINISSVPTNNNSLTQILGRNASTGEIEYRDVSTIGGGGGGGIPIVDDEADRDSTYPSPTNEQQVFNLKQRVIETYYTAFGLWLSPHLRPILTPLQTNENVGGVTSATTVSVYDAIVRSSTIQFTSGTYPIQDAFPTPNTPTNNASADFVLGCIQQISTVNITFASTVYYFASVAVGGIYTCRVRTDPALTISAGDNLGVRSTNTSRSVTNNSAGQSKVGIAIEDMRTITGLPYNYVEVNMNVRSNGMV